jgi:hypothetical protein
MGGGAGVRAGTGFKLRQYKSFCFFFQKEVLSSSCRIKG